MRYWDITIWTWDQKYLDELADKLNIDYDNAGIYIDEYTNSIDLTNQLFNYVLEEAIEQLDISQDNKEYLKTKICLNCLDSGIDIPLEEVNDLIDGTDEEKEIIRDFIEKVW